MRCGSAWRRIDITEFNERIVGIVDRQSVLREQIDAIVADLEGGTP